MTFEELKAKAISLPAEQKQELITALQATLQFSKSNITPTRKREAEDYLHDYLTDAVRRFCVKRGLCTRVDAWAVIKREIERLKQYPQDNEIVRRWIEEKVKPEGEVERQFIADTFVNSLYNHLKDNPYYKELGIGPYELLINIRKLPTAVDGSFPGYANAGLLPLIIRREMPSVSNKRLRRGKRKAQR